MDALFAQAGVIGCRDAEDLARTAVLLTEQPLPAGRRLAILSNAGGIGVLAADAAAEEGFDVVEFSPELQRRAGRRSCTAPPAPRTRSTPAPGCHPTELADAVRHRPRLGRGGRGAGGPGRDRGHRRQPDDDRAGAGAGAAPGDPGGRRTARRTPAGSPATTPITTYRTTASALRALGRSVRYAEWLAEESEPPQLSDPAQRVAARERVRATLAGVDSRWLDAAQSAELLEAWGIPLLGAPRPTRPPRPWSAPRGSGSRWR